MASVGRFSTLNQGESVLLTLKSRRCDKIAGKGGPTIDRIHERAVRHSPTARLKLKARANHLYAPELRLPQSVEATSALVDPISAKLLNAALTLRSGFPVQKGRK
ncbi:hypothetical protein MKK51_00975 [Methylobacterium sp. E-045]|nr:hypothetical protein [Methylobacterium sp. E-045]